MAVTGPQPELGRGNLTREPLAVRPGRDPILFALHYKDRRAYLCGVKAPRRDANQSSPFAS